MHVTCGFDHREPVLLLSQLSNKVDTVNAQSIFHCRFLIFDQKRDLQPAAASLHQLARLSQLEAAFWDAFTSVTGAHGQRLVWPSLSSHRHFAESPSSRRHLDAAMSSALCCLSLKIHSSMYSRRADLNAQVLSAGLHMTQHWPSDELIYSQKRGTSSSRDFSSYLWHLKMPANMHPS